MSNEAKKLSTVALHAGQVPDPTTGARAVPIYQTTSFVFKSTEHAANLFALKEFGNIYTRIMNPTTDVFEQRVAAIEGGTGALAVSSGQAASTTALLGITQLGDEIVSANNLYGGTYQLLHYTMPKLGRTTHFVDSQKPEAFRKAITPKTRAIFAETIGNPKLDVPDFEALAGIAHEAGIPLVVDNTVEWAWSSNRLRSGHHCGFGDEVHWRARDVDRGFYCGFGQVQVEQREVPGVYRTGPELPRPGVLGCVRKLSRDGQRGFYSKIRVQLLRDIGAAMSPFNAFMFLQGLETLPLRQRQHSANALEVAGFLKTHPLVSWVTYPGLPDSPNHKLAARYLKQGFGGLIGFGIKGGLDAGRKFINSVKLFSHLANIGDAKSLVIHPGSTTHQQLSAEEQAATGVTPDYIRLSVGLEDIADIKADLEQALQASQK